MTERPITAGELNARTPEEKARAKAAGDAYWAALRASAKGLWDETAAAALERAFEENEAGKERGA